MTQIRKRNYTFAKYYRMSLHEKRSLLDAFRPILAKHVMEWGQSLAKRKTALEMSMTGDLTAYLATIVDRIEPLEGQLPPEQYLVRRSFERLDPEMQNEIGQRVKLAVMDKMLNATGKIRLIEAEREVSRETRISLSLVKDFSPSFDMVQRKKKAM